MYVTNRTTFPKTETFRVPYFSIERFDGKTLTLSPQLEYVWTHLGELDASSIAQATSIRPDGGELRGLIAVDARVFALTLKQAGAANHLQQVGTVLDGRWYWLRPLDVQFVYQRGKPLVVGLYC